MQRLGALPPGAGRGWPDRVDRRAGFARLEREIDAAAGDPLAEQFLVILLLWLNPCAAKYAQVPDWPDELSDLLVGTMTKSRGKTEAHVMAASPIEVYATFITRYDTAHTYPQPPLGAPM